MTSSKPAESSTLEWQVASRCNNGSCVEIAKLPCGGVGIRDSKDKGGPILEFSVTEFRAFINGIKDGSLGL